MFNLFRRKQARKSAPDHAAREKRQKIEIVRSTPTGSVAKKETKVRDNRPQAEQQSKQRTETRATQPTSPKSQRNDRNNNRPTASNHRSRDRKPISSREGSRRQQHPVKSHDVIKKVPPLPELKDIPEQEGVSRFFDFDLEKEILAACQDNEFKYCTPIQAKSFPITLKGQDLTGKAQTGTGKTAAFLISAINFMLRNPKENRLPGSCRMLVLAPTRELAIQIHKDAEELCKYTHLRNLVVFGGMDHAKQREQLSHPIDILVGTPGRIIDFSRSGALKLNHADILVIDEADRMLDMGFIPDVRRIVYKLPSAGKRQTMFFSATFDPKILRLVESWLHEPITIEVESENIVSTLIDQTFYSVTGDKKLPLLLWFLKNDNVERMLIFVNRKDTAQFLLTKLQRNKITCGLLTGDVQQNKRLKILESFRNGSTKIIVATDVAARGIHVDDVSHVVNYDLPYEPQDYVHRIGRTGRAGNKGKSISFLCEYGSFVMPDIEEILGEEIKSIQPTPEMFKY